MPPLGRCTCGEKLPVDASRHYDITHHCEQVDHSRCDGQLRAATGFHWWCACECHSEPNLQMVAFFGDDWVRALETWREARKVRA